MTLTRGRSRVLGVALGLGLASTSAWGNEFGDGFVAYDRYQNFSYHSLTAGNADASTWVRSNVMNPTDLQAYLNAPGMVDVDVYDGYYGDTGWVGVTQPKNCTWSGSRWKCNSNVKFNLSYPSYYDTASERRHIACHEFGHTVGLNHTTNQTSCMGPPGTLYWSSHDVEHINAYY